MSIVYNNNLLPSARIMMAIYRFALECRCRLPAGAGFPDDAYGAIYVAVAFSLSESENGSVRDAVGKLASRDFVAVAAPEIEVAFLELHERGVLTFGDAAVLGMILACVHGLVAEGRNLMPLVEQLMARCTVAMERTGRLGL